jgi:hypothetical protein
MAHLDPNHLGATRDSGVPLQAGVPRLADEGNLVRQSIAGSTGRSELTTRRTSAVWLPNSPRHRRTTSASGQTLPTQYLKVFAASPGKQIGGERKDYPRTTSSKARAY